MTKIKVKKNKVKIKIAGTRIHEPVEQLNVTPSEEEQSFGGLYSPVVVDKINTEELTPELDFSQSDSIKIEPSEGKYIKKITINKDEELVPNNIRSGKNINGIDGTMEVIDLEEYFTHTVKAGTAQTFPGWHSMLNDFPDWEYTTTATSGYYMFYGYPGKNLPKIDTSNFKNFDYFCDNADKIVEVSGIDTSNATSMKSAFNGCENLLRVLGIDTSNVTGTGLTYCFANSYKIEEISPINCQNATSLRSTFYGFNGEELIVMNTNKVTTFNYAFIQQPNIKRLSELDGDSCIEMGQINGALLEDFNGIKNLGMAYDATKSANYANYKFDLSKCLNLTRESVINIINNLYDIASLGVQTQTIDLHYQALSKLTAEEIAVATNKGWTVI